jgi:hypothetical protein
MASLDKRKAARRDFPQRGLFFFELRMGGVELAGRGLTQSSQRAQRAQRKETQTVGARVRRRRRNVAGNDSSPRRLQERFGSASSWEEDTPLGDSLRPADRLHSNFFGG